MSGALIKAAQKRMAGGKAKVAPMAKEGGNKMMKVLKTAAKKRMMGMK